MKKKNFKYKLKITLNATFFTEFFPLLSILKPLFPINSLTTKTIYSKPRHSPCTMHQSHAQKLNLKCFSYIQNIFF